MVGHVEINVGGGAYTFAPIQELVGAEPVIFRPLPCKCPNGGPQLFRADTVPPTIFMHHGAARPSDNRDVEPLQQSSDMQPFLSVKIDNAAVDHIIVHILQHLAVDHRVDGYADRRDPDGDPRCLCAGVHHEENGEGRE